MNIQNLPGATPLEPEVLEQLIPSLTTQPELNAFEAQNIAKAELWARGSRKLKKELLTASGLHLLHKKMFDETWKWAGENRWLATTIGVDVGRIGNELGGLLGDVKYWIEHQTYSLEEIAVRFHHRLVWIHLFPNGNGRFSRLAADLFLEQNGKRRLSWGGENLSKMGETRKEYLRALQSADQGEFAPLIAFATRN